MSETTNLNSELLSADARGRKHIPFAVFAVILIHIALFVFLLVAAGCRAKARAKRKPAPAPELLAQQPGPAALAVTNAVVPVATRAITQPWVAAEPPARKQAAQSGLKKAAPSPQSRPTAASAQTKVYIVKAGDTVEKIARMHRTSVEAIKSENNLKNHLLKPGQQLRVSTQKTRVKNEV